MNTMRRGIAGLLLGAFLVGVSLAARAEDFTGSWVYLSADGKASLAFDLTQKGEKLTGYHNCTVRGGNRVDAVLPGDPPSIVGTVSGRKAQVTFRSGYGDGKGTAEMTLGKDHTLSWKILEFQGNHYLMESAVLKKEPQGK